MDGGWLLVPKKEACQMIWWNSNHGGLWIKEDITKKANVDWNLSSPFVPYEVCQNAVVLQNFKNHFLPPVYLHAEVLKKEF